MIEILSFFSTIAVITVAIILGTKTKDSEVTKTGTINQYSYQRYAKFYNNTVPADKDFNIKINKIYSLIVNDKKTDIREIALKSGCTYDECVLKIRYLKNKRQIGDYHIDHQNYKLLKCTKEENELLIKYKPFIYNNHLSVKEIAARLPGTNMGNLNEVSDQVYEDILGLYKSDLINGIKINEVDKEIIYYTIEKRKKEKDFISLRCESCGALNDVNRGSKIRCEYCNTIIEDKTVE